MSQSVLIGIARRSIEEVLQAEKKIERAALLEQYPLLEQPMATRITLYVGDKVRGSAFSESANRPLVDDIIRNAKLAAFQDERFDPLVTSEYLHCSIELTLFAPEGELTHRDEAILKE